MSDANSISDLERAEHLGYAESKGVKRVSVFNDGVQINVATEETLKAVAGFNIPAYDYVERGWTAETFTEVWTFKTGGSGGTTVGTITIVYDDASMTNIISVTKT